MLACKLYLLRFNRLLLVLGYDGLLGQDLLLLRRRQASWSLDHVRVAVSDATALAQRCQRRLRALRALLHDHHACRLRGLVVVGVRGADCAARRLPVLDDAKRAHSRLALLLERGRVRMRLRRVARGHLHASRRDRARNLCLRPGSTLITLEGHV